MSGNNKGYQFTITNGVVSSVYELKNGRLKRESIDADETWSVNGGDVIKTEYEHGRSEITTYSDLDGDGIYTKVSKSYANIDNSSVNSQYQYVGSSHAHSSGYQFNLINGVVSQVYEVENGYKKIEHVSVNEAWTTDGSNFTKTEYEHGVVEQSVYTDNDGDGLYTRVSKTYLNGDGTLVSSSTYSRYGDDSDNHWNGSNSDDYYYGSSGNDSMSGGDGDDDLVGGDGDDLLTGGYGDDSLISGYGNDHLNGGDGNDYLYSGDGDDLVDAGAGDDIIVGGDGAGNDKYHGGLGVDTVKYTSAKAGITVDLLKGCANSSVGGDLAGVGVDTLDGIENVIAGNYDDLIKGNNQSNILTGGLGSDSLYGGLDRVRDIFNFDDVAESVRGLSRDKVFNFSSKIDDIDLFDIDANSLVSGNQSFIFNNQTAKSNAIWYRVADVDGNKFTKDVVVYGDINGDLTADFEIGLVGVTSLNIADFIL